MSNPGVIYLANKKIGNSPFKVEDNIGESIHIHYDELRIDLTVAEFLTISSDMIESLNNLIDVKGFNARNYDPLFIEMCSGFLMDLVEVEQTTIKLEELKVQTVGMFGLPVMRSISRSRVTKALNGNAKEQMNHKQENYRGLTNLDRMDLAYRSVKENGYPYKDQFIVLFNDQNFIRDGQHRAAALYHLGGNKEIPIVRWHFKDRKYNSTNYPWVYYLLKWNKKRLIQIARIQKKLFNNYFKRAKWKVRKMFMFRGL